MPIPYSNDLRQKALNMIDSGILQKEVASILKINRTTLLRWKKRRKEQGNCDFKGYNKNQDKVKIKDIPRFTEFIKKNKLFSLAQMTEKWQGSNCVMTIYNNLKKLGYSYKKTVAI